MTANSLQKRIWRNVDSRFRLLFGQYFEKQWDDYGEGTRQLIADKLRMVSANPYRFRKHKGYRGVFKVKLSVGGVYSRLMYAVHMPESNFITVLGVFPRKLDYKDFERLFGYLQA